MYRFSFSHIFRMENGIEMVFVSIWFLIPAEYFDSKTTIWPPDNISLIYLCWVTFNTKYCFIQLFTVDLRHITSRFLQPATQVSYNAVPLWILQAGRSCEGM